MSSLSSSGIGPASGRAASMPALNASSETAFTGAMITYGSGPESPECWPAANACPRRAMKATAAASSASAGASLRPQGARESISSSDAPGSSRAAAV